MSSRAFAYRRAAERRLIYALVIVLAVMIMLPFVWLLLMSFKTNDDIFAFPPKLFFTPTLQNYAGLWASSFRYSFLNSAVVSVTSTLLALLVGVPGAYALSRMSIRHQKPLSLLILASRMAPPIAFTIPYFLAYRWMGLLDTRIGLILIYLTFNISLVVWLMRSFFDACPRSLEEAAWVDGATLWQGFTRIMLPISGPGVAATAILCFLYSWNDFFFALILTRNQAMTAPVAVVNFMNYEGWEWGKIAAGGTMVMLPVLIFSMLVRKFLISGMTTGAVKG
jgi:multiple sugar transport system permease protein